MANAADRPDHGGDGPFAFIYNENVRNIFYQALTFALIALVVWYLFTNTAANLEARGMSSGFGFLWKTAGFDTDFKLVSYSAGDTYGRIYVVGLLNTLFVAFFSIILTTLLGFMIGIMRLSSNWLLSRVAGAYVEILRNTPLLLQIVFWYLAVFTLLPRPKQSVDIGGLGVSYLNNRGLYLPDAQPDPLFWFTGVAILLAIAGTVWLKRWAKARQDATGEQFPVFWTSVALLFGLPAIVYLATGTPLDWSIPELRGFNFQDGLRMPPALLALAVALVIYHSSYMGEMVRAGIQSVHSGQTEAAYAVGLRHGPTLRLVIIPQAMRAIVPPMISLWMNVVKNSSLAVAIGYPDIVSVFMQTALNQSGYAIEIVAMTMLFYMTVSLLISFALNIYNKRVQLVER